MARTRHRQIAPAAPAAPTSDAPYEADAPMSTSRTAVTVGFGRAPSASPPCAICDCAPSDPMQSVMSLALSLDPAEVTSSALLAVITHYHSVLADYDELRRAYTLARQHNEELHAAPAALREVAIRYVDFVQRKYDSSQAQLAGATLRAADTETRMARMQDELRQFEVLRIQHDLLHETSTEAITHLQNYAARLERQIDGRVIDGTLQGSVSQIAQDLSDVRRENSDLHRQLSDHHNQIRAVEASRTTTDAELAQSRTRCDGLQTRLKDLLKHAQKVEKTNQRLRGDLRAMSGGDSAMHSLRLELHVRSERIRELNGLLDRVCAHRDRHQENLRGATHRAQLASAAVYRVNEALSRQHEAAHDAQRRAHDLEDQLTRLRQDRARHARDYQTLSADFRRSQERLAQANARVGELGQLRSETGVLREELRVALSTQATLQADKETLQVELMAVRESSVPTATAATPAVSVSNPVPCRSYRDLLAQIADIQGAYGHLRCDFDDLEADFRSLETEHDELETVYGTLTEDHASALERIQQIASLAVVDPPHASGVAGSKRKHPPSARSISSQTPASKRICRGSPAVLPRSRTRSLGSCVGPSSADQSSTVRTVVDPADDGQDADYVCSEAGTEPSDTDSATSVDETLRMLARVRISAAMVQVAGCYPPRRDLLLPPLRWRGPRLTTLPAARLVLKISTSLPAYVPLAPPLTSSAPLFVPSDPWSRSSRGFGSSVS